MRKIILGIFLIVSIVFFTFGVNAQTITPTPTDSTLVTTPIVTNTPTPVASSSATPTKVTKLPKTGIIQYSAALLMIGAVVILVSFVF